MSWSIRIPQASPSQNQFAWSNWRVAHKSKAEWAMRIRCAPGFLAIPKATGRRRLTIERIGWRKLDPLNLLGGAKGLVDCLVQAGLLVDDSEQWLEVATPLQRIADHRKGENPHTWLHLEDCA